MNFFFDREHGSPDSDTLIFAQTVAGTSCSNILKFNKFGVRLYDTSFPLHVVDYQPGTTRVRIIGIDDI